MELDDCAFDTLHGVVVTDKAEVAFKDINYGLLVGARPRGPGMERKDLLQANAHYYPILRADFERLRPAFIYERLCLGNYCGARLSQDLGVPYIVEYNGS